MFTKNKVSQSLLDAVNKVITEDKVEPEQLNESGSVKIQTPTGTKVLGHRYGNSAKAHRDQTADPFAGHKGPGKKDLEKIEKPKKEVSEELKGNQSKIDKNHNNRIDAQDFKILRGEKKSLKKMKEELDEPVLDELINEVLSKDASAGDWIHDFVHSDNPKFAGKSKAKRKEMALAAYYAKQRKEGVELEDEELEQIDEQTPWDDGKGPSPSNFKKPNNPRRTGMDTARALARKALDAISHGSDARLRKDLRDKVRKEAVEEPKKGKKTTDTLAGPVKGGADNQHTSYKVTLKAEESKPLTMSKEIAKKAYKKLKTETMMGKISN